MTDPMNDRVEQAYADFARHRKSLMDAHHELAGGVFTVTAKKRAFRVTVDGGGELTEIKFLSNAYRALPPAELADMLVEAVSQARRQALAAAVTTFQGLLPDLPVEDIMTGTVNLDALFDDALLRTDLEGKGHGDG